MAARVGDVDLQGLQPHVFWERYSDWTGRAWLDIEGEGGRRLTRQVIGPGYGELRKTLTQRFPGRPWQADWADGHFPAAPFGAPLGLVMLLALAAWMAVLVGAGLWGGGGPALVVAAVGVWPLARWLDGVSVLSDGIRVGPPWALVVPWHEVQRVGVHRVGREVRVWMVHRLGAASGSVPAPLLPALRAQLRRRGGLVLERSSGGLDVRYALWRPAAAGLPWGVVAGTVAGAPLSADPWQTLLAGGLVAAGLTLLGAAVEARATGWGMGAVGWLTLLHAMLLGLLAMM
jgi:hypothetical protein